MRKAHPVQPAATRAVKELIKDPENGVRVVRTELWLRARQSHAIVTLYYQHYADGLPLDNYGRPMTTRNTRLCSLPLGIEATPYYYGEWPPLPECTDCATRILNNRFMTEERSPL